VSLALTLICGFLIGGFPTGIIACRLVKGVDPRTIGSGGMGATNVSRVLGKKWAAAVLLIDALKGFLPVQFLAPLLVPETQLVAARLIMSAAVIAGHVWTPYAGFRGGKGVATAAGAMLAIDPVSLLSALAAWGIVFAIGHIVSVASVVAALVFPIAMFTFGSESPAYRTVSVLLAAFLIYTHRSNLKRLLHREEKPLV
jgi:acyl phosphate:glycerol-3-phosphate acyltransferase